MIVGLKTVFFGEYLVIKGSWRGRSNPISQSIFFSNPTSQCSNGGICTCFLLFASTKLMASKCNPAKTKDSWRFLKMPWRVGGGLLISVLDSGLSGPGSRPGRGHCVVCVLFMGKTLYSHRVSQPFGSYADFAFAFDFFLRASKTHVKFLSFLPAGNLSCDFSVFVFFQVWSDGSCSVLSQERCTSKFTVTVTWTKAVYLFVVRRLRW